MREETNERSRQVYDVALWCSWPVLFPDHVGHIQASGSYAASRQVGHPRIDRWSKVYIPLTVEKRASR